MTERDPEHLVGRRHLQVERQFDVRGQPFDVRVGHVPPVLAQMGGDAVRAGGRREEGRAHGVGMPAAAGRSGSSPRGRYLRQVEDVGASTRSVGAGRYQ